MTEASKSIRKSQPQKTDSLIVAGQLEMLLAQLDEDQATDRTVIDIQGRSSIADYIIVASGRSSRHLRSMADHLVMRLKAAKMPPLGVEGEREGEWVLIDTGDIIVHLMLPKIRDFYNIESLWQFNPRARLETSSAERLQGGIDQNPDPGSDEECDDSDNAG